MEVMDLGGEEDNRMETPIGQDEDKIICWATAMAVEQRRSKYYGRTVAMFCIVFCVIIRDSTHSNARDAWERIKQGLELDSYEYIKI